MPASEKDIQHALKAQDHKEWLKWKGEWKFYRSALERELVGDKDAAREMVRSPGTTAPLRSEENADAVEWGTKTSTVNESYLIKQPVESELSYAIRTVFAFDGNESYRTLRTIVGYLLRDTNVNLDGFSNEYREVIQTNIDGKKTGWKQFVEEAAEEIAGIGKAFGWLYTPKGQNLPIHEFIDREKVRDWHMENDAFVYAKFEDCREKFMGVIRVEQKRTVILTPDMWYFCTLIEDSGEYKVEQIPFKANFVPLVDGWCGKYARSVIATAAHLQFILMNADSVAFQIIRNQMIAIMVGPTGTKDQLREVTTNTVLDIPAQATVGFQIVGYPKQTIDGHLEYLQRMAEKVSLSANLREQVALGASGESKDWDFMPTAAMLDRLADAVEAYVNEVLGMFEKFADIAPSKEKRFSINRNFDKKGLKETLDLIFQGIAMQLGAKMTEKLKVHAASLFAQVGVQINDADLEQIAQEIQDIGKSDHLKSLLEVSLNGQNQRITEGAGSSGGRDNKPEADTGD